MDEKNFILGKLARLEKLKLRKFYFGTKLHHAPRCKAWFYLVQVLIMGMGFTDDIYIMLAFGPGTYQRHFALDDIYELWQLIYTPFAHKPSPIGDTGVHFTG